MNIVGLITEYNPFHNGHKYHIEKALELTRADAAVVVMSGDFVQRGTPAIMPKHLRAQAALLSGASVVLELPVCYATGSAEYFALGAVSLLEQLGCVNSICFGTESGDLKPLQEIADIICEEPAEYKTALQNYLRSGCSFPIARQKALADYLPDRELSSFLETPNNILGVEYLKALKKTNSNIVPYAIKREESNYHDTELQTSLSSASAIRKAIHSDGLSLLENQVPAECHQLMKETYLTRYPVLSDDFSLLLKYKLLTTDKEKLTEFVDVTEELANRIFNRRNEFVSFDQFCELLKTREMTYTRICRALIHILLEIRKTDLTDYLEHGINGYAHMLGFRMDSTAVLTSIKQNSRIPLLSKLTNTDDLSESGRSMLAKDIFASDLYESIITNKFKTAFINEYEQSIVRI